MVDMLSERLKANLKSSLVGAAHFQDGLCPCALPTEIESEVAGTLFGALVP